MSQSPRMIIFMTALDTTWRVFAPSLGGLGIGIVLDGQFHTKPIMTVIGLIIGTTGSFALIVHQLNSVRKP